MPVITLAFGADAPLPVEIESGTILSECRGPEGVTGAAALDLVTAAVATPAHGPPLEAHVVPGDRAVVALTGGMPQAEAIVAAISGRLCLAGVAASDVAVLRAAPLEGHDPGRPAGAVADANASACFDPTGGTATAYLAADASGQPLYLARALVDADVVVAVGGWGWNAALGGRSLEGELWPAFSRIECRQDLVVSLARRGRHALSDWRSSTEEINWQLGVCASLRLVAGRQGSLYAACFGLPDEAGRMARAAAAAWCPLLDEPAELTIATVADPQAGFAAITRAVAAAARVTQPGGTICVASRVAVGPGIIFLRWRQGAPLEKILHEAVATRDAALVADALQARLFARALGDRRLVLLSDIDEGTVEELGFGFAAGPEAMERIAHRAESVAVLHEADLMLPNPG